MNRPARPDDMEILAATPLFKGLPKNYLEDVRRIAMGKDFKKGEAIFFEGDEADGFYVVVAGRVKVFKLSLDGKEQIFHILGPGEPFGEVPVFAGEDFPANAEAMAPSRLFFFPREAFAGLITEDPSLALNMLAILSKRLRQFTVQVEHLSFKEVPGRLAVYLLYLSDQKGGQAHVRLAISKGQLASLLGTIPETLSRILAKMSRAGLIRVKGPRIEIVDRQGLELLSATGKGLV